MPKVDCIFQYLGLWTVEHIQVAKADVTHLYLMSIEALRCCIVKHICFSFLPISIILAALQAWLSGLVVNPITDSSILIMQFDVKYDIDNSPREKFEA